MVTAGAAVSPFTAAVSEIASLAGEASSAATCSILAHGFATYGDGAAIAETGLACVETVLIRVTAVSPFTAASAEGAPRAGVSIRTSAGTVRADLFRAGCA